MRRKIVVATLPILIAGCATGYHSTGYTGGYSDTQLAPDVFRVSFRGNAYTQPERVQDLALLRAAELTLSHGYTHFGIMKEATGSTESSFTTPGQAYSTGQVQVYGQSALYSGQTTYIPGQTLRFHKPRASLLIKCFHGEQPGVDLFEARFLRRSVSEKYRVKD